MSAPATLTHDAARRLVRDAVAREAERLGEGARSVETGALLRHAARCAGAAADLALVRDEVERARLLQRTPPMAETAHPFRTGIRPSVSLYIAFGAAPKIVTVTIPCKRRLAVASDFVGDPIHVVENLSTALTGETLTIDADTPLRWATDAEIEAHMGEDDDG